jgi:hypothetical protein
VFCLIEVRGAADVAQFERDVLQRVIERVVSSSQQPVVCNAFILSCFTLILFLLFQ